MYIAGAVRALAQLRICIFFPTSLRDLRFAPFPPELPLRPLGDKAVIYPGQLAHLHDSQPSPAAIQQRAPYEFLPKILRRRVQISS